MAAPRSRRARILINLQRQLETITTANGYTNTVRKVSQNLKNWHDTLPAETPVIYIIDNNTVAKYNPGSLLEWEWSVSLFVVMKDKSQSDMEEMISDMMECLYKNVTLAFSPDNILPVQREIAHMRIANITTDGQFFSEFENSQLFRMDLDLIYTGCVTSIR